MSFTAPRTWITGEVLTKALLDEQIRDNISFLKTNIALEPAVELTISSGSVTKSCTHHTVDTESDAATDDLDTISGGAEGEVVLIRPASGSRTVVVKHGTGNIWNMVAKDVILDDADDYVILIYSGSKWCVLGGSGQVDVSGTPAAGNYAVFLDGDTIEGKTKAQVISDLGAITAIPDMLGFVIMFVPAANGLYYDDTNHDVRIRTDAATPGDNILISQGIRWNNNQLQICH